METQSSKKWYDNTWLVVVLCMIFFPVGLYALWKNSYISKSWKIGVTAFFALLVISQLGTLTKLEKNKTSENQLPTDSIIPQQITEKMKEQTTQQKLENTVQQDFLKKKADLFYSSVIKPTNSATTTMFKGKSEKMTKDFLKETNNTLTDWYGTVISVMASDEKGIIVGGDDKQKKILILIVDAGRVTFDDGEDFYSLALTQAQGSKRKTKGIYPNSLLYDKVINLNEGQKIKFSAKILLTEEQGLYGTSSKNHRKYDFQETSFDVEFTELDVIP
jgi:hypothetical protein